MLLKLNLTNVREVVFEKESFSHLKVSNASTFQILINKFGRVRIATAAFSQIEQADSSNFELNLANGRKVVVSEYAFANLTQAVMAKFILFFNILESNVCLKSHTLDNVVQAKNSTVRLTFLLNDANDLVLGENSLINIKQNVNSFVQIYVLRSRRFVVATNGVVNLTQSKSSSFEVWTSRGSFYVQASAFRRVIQDENASIRIGFTASSADSVYSQAVNSFVEFVPHANAELVYDFTKGLNIFIFQNAYLKRAF